MLSECPVCQKKFQPNDTVTMMERHVNRCLDGQGEQEEENHVSGQQQVVHNNTMISPSQSLPPPPSSSGGTTRNAAAVLQQHNSGPVVLVGQPQRHEDGRVLDGSSSGSNNMTVAKDGCTNSDSLIAMFQEIVPEASAELANALLQQSHNDLNFAIELYYSHQLNSLAAIEERKILQRQRLALLAAMSSPSYDEDEEGDDGHQKKIMFGGQRHMPQPPSDVELVVYDLAPDSVGKKFGMGIYHSAVMVYEREYSFGGHENPKEATEKELAQSGIFYLTKYSPSLGLPVKKRVLIGQTNFSLEEIIQFVQEWGKEEWQVGKYHLLAKNCNHFADAFLKKLGEKMVFVSSSMIGINDVSGYEKEKKKEGLRCDGKGPSSLMVDDALSSSCPAPGSQGIQQQNNKNISAAIDTPLQFASKEEEKRFQKEKKEATEKWALPPWVNRAARVGDTLVPDWVFNKVMEKMTTPSASAGEKDQEKSDPEGEQPTKKNEKEKESVIHPPSSVQVAQEKEKGSKEKVGGEVIVGDLPSSSVHQEYHHDGEVFVNEQDVQTVSSILPHLSPQQIKMALRKYHGNVEVAINSLL